MDQHKHTVMAQLVALREDLAEQIAKMIVNQPKKSYPVIAKEFGVSRSTVIAAAHKYDVTRRSAEASKDATMTNEEKLNG